MAVELALEILVELPLHPHHGRGKHTAHRGLDELAREEPIGFLKHLLNGLKELNLGCWALDGDYDGRPLFLPIQSASSEEKFD